MKPRFFISPDYLGVVAALTEDDATFLHTARWRLERPFAYAQVGMAFYQCELKFPDDTKKIRNAWRRWLLTVETIWPGSRIPAHIRAAEQAIRRFEETAKAVANG